jgi:hypothetical protein
MVGDKQKTEKQFPLTVMGVHAPDSPLTTINISRIVLPHMSVKSPTIIQNFETLIKLFKNLGNFR